MATSDKFSIKDFKDVSSVIKLVSEKLGAKFDGPSLNARYREYSDERGYIAITRADQESSGPYSGLSFAIFPIREKDDCYTCVVTICIGTDDLGEDEELSELPWFRRSYTDLNDAGNSNKGFFVKTSFSDAVNEIPSMVETLGQLAENEEANLSKIKDYYRCITAAIIVDIDSADKEVVGKNIESERTSHGMKVLMAWLAQYAKIRGWEYGKRGVYDYQDKLISRIKTNDKRTEESLMQEICELLYEAKYIVIQGAPGTGKTRIANKIAISGITGHAIKFEKPDFTQFHAETTYTDFVGGIRPVLSKKDANQFQFEYKEGILTTIIKKALNNKDKNYLLIIDEINRGNLKNILGPVFYLFERPIVGGKDKRAEITLDTSDGNAIKLSELPSNVYVIATMNTSDRSLAMVDFALRRRFSWYTLLPYDLSGILGNRFHTKLFNRISELFDKYATDGELPLQPGHSYFIASDDKEMKFRMKYEIMPLMKEYFAAGLMLRAQNEFAAIYYDCTGEFMYR